MRDAAEMILLGTGTSVGVPVIGCPCEVCQSAHPRNQRTRSGVCITGPGGNFLIDTPPELRMQLLRERIDEVQAAIYTHSHADHIMGLDDLRIFGHRLKRDIPLYCEPIVEEQLRQSFNYAFREPPAGAHHFSIPKLEIRPLDERPLQLLGLPIQPIRLLHGRLPVLGFRIGRVAFCTDVSEIPEASWPLLENLDVLILDALRDDPHPTHFGIGQSLEVIERVQPRRAYLTHISHSLDYESTNARLPDHVELAYDGLRIPLNAEASP